MKLATPKQKRDYLNSKLSKIPSRTVLQDWLNQASGICPELATALEGIYCGREGRVHQKLTGGFESIYLTMGWYTVTDTPRVEFAYVS